MNLLSVNKLRGDNGKIVNATTRDVAEAAIMWMTELSWTWARDVMAGCCLKWAMRGCNAATADLWIERYRAIRGIR